MTNDPKAAWDRVGTSGSELGAKLKHHFEEARGEDAAEATEALRKLADAVGDAFDAVGNAVRDPDVRAEARTVAGSLGDALAATFAGVSDEVRKIFNRTRDGDGGPGPATPGTPTGPTDDA